MPNAEETRVLTEKSAIFKALTNHVIATAKCDGDLGALGRRGGMFWTACREYDISCAEVLVVFRRVLEEVHQGMAPADRATAQTMPRSAEVAEP